MKTEKLMTIYICDCCGKEMLEEPDKMLTGCRYDQYGDVSYEPKVMGDYCEDCLSLAQEHQNSHGSHSIIGDRYDRYDENVHEREVTIIKGMKDKRDEYDYEHDLLTTITTPPMVQYIHRMS